MDTLTRLWMIEGLINLELGFLEPQVNHLNSSEWLIVSLKKHSSLICVLRDIK